MHWNFTKETPYFVFDPEGDGLSYFATEKERDKFSENCIENYLDDGWDENVIHVLGGKVTHRATEIDRTDRPDVVNEDGYDDDGDHWPPEITHKCRYELLPITA